MTMLLSLALAMLVGLLFTRLAKLVHLPNVTAYLVAGLLIGPRLPGAGALGCAQIHGYHFHRGAGLHRLLHRRRV